MINARDVKDLISTKVHSINLTKKSTTLQITSTRLRVKNLVEEWKSSDEVIKSVKSWRHQILRVVTKQLQDGKHGNTAVLKFGEGSLPSDFRCHVKLSKLEFTKESIVVNGSNEEEHLCPNEGWEGI